MNSEGRNRLRAFTVVELMIVIVAIAVLIGLLLPYLAHQREQSLRIKCVNHLKSASLAFKIFASDGGDRYPYQVVPPLTNATPQATIALTNATLAAPASTMFAGQTQQAAWAHWGFISNELGSPKILICPGNRRKKNNVATDWTTNHRRGFSSEQGLLRMTGNSSHLRDRPEYGQATGYDTSVSYFICLDADETIPAGIMIGDFNLEWDGRSTDPFIDNPRGAGNQMLSGSDFDQLTWVMGAGPDRAWAHHKKAGNIALTDGSVLQTDAAQLRQVARASTNAWGKTTMHLLIPR